MTGRKLTLIFFILLITGTVYGAGDVFIGYDLNVISGLETDPVIISGSFFNLNPANNGDVNVGIEIVNAKGFTVFACCDGGLKLPANDPSGMNTYSGAIAPTSPLTFTAADSPYFATFTLYRGIYDPGNGAKLEFETTLGNNQTTETFIISKPIVQNIPETDWKAVFLTLLGVIGILYSASKKQSFQE